MTIDNLTDFEIRQIVDDYISGYPIADILMDHQITSGALYHQLRKNNVRLRTEENKLKEQKK